jgi:hypothetical protein
MFPTLATNSSPSPIVPIANACPVCGDTLMEMRGVYRCGRCQFAICLNCEGERAEAVEPDGSDW